MLGYYPAHLRATVPLASHLSRVVVAVLAFAAATSVTLALWDVVFYRVPFALFFAAVAFAAWRAGVAGGDRRRTGGGDRNSFTSAVAPNLLLPSLILLGVSVIISLLAATRERALAALGESEARYASDLPGGHP